MNTEPRHAFKNGDRVRITKTALALPGNPHGLSHAFRTYALRGVAGTVVEAYEGKGNPRVKFGDDNYQYYIPMDWLVLETPI